MSKIFLSVNSLNLKMVYWSMKPSSLPAIDLTEKSEFSPRWSTRFIFLSKESTSIIYCIQFCVNIGNFIKGWEVRIKIVKFGIDFYLKRGESGVNLSNIIVKSNNVEFFYWKWESLS